MRGKIGSGKTYTARRICEETGARLLSVDYYMESVFGNLCVGRERHVQAESVVLSFCLEMAKTLDSFGESAVIDHGFWLKSELYTAESFLKENGIDYRVVTASADFETRLERVISRSDGKCFDKDKLLRFDCYFEE